MGGVTSRTTRTTSLLCKKKEAAVLQESTGQDIYFSMADIIDFIDSEYNVVCRKTLVPWAPRHDNTASLPSRTGTKDSELNISPLIISSFSCLKNAKNKRKRKYMESLRRKSKFHALLCEVSVVSNFFCSLTTCKELTTTRRVYIKCEFNCGQV